MLQVWKVLSVGTLPGLLILGLIMGGRMVGAFQFSEWRLFDLFMKVPIPEATDDRIVLVTIDEPTIKTVGTYPLPDQYLATLLDTLDRYQPRVIGLDVFRDFPVEPGYQELTQVFQRIDNLIAIEKVLPISISPPPIIPPDRIGINDALIDLDGRQRSLIAGTQTPQGFKFSFALRIVELYLAKEGITLANGLEDPTTMRFGTLELPRFYPNFGSYVGGNSGSGSIQVLINFRRGNQPFRLLSSEAILTGQFDPDWISDRIVLIGVTTPSVADYATVAANSVVDQDANWIYGVEIQAHAISQMISAVLDDRPLIKSWSDWMEYAWIMSWGLMGVSVAAYSRSPWQTITRLLMYVIGLVGFSYGLFVFGWWIPVVPVVLVFVVNTLALAVFYEYDRKIVAIMEAKQNYIVSLEEQVRERTFALQNANQQLEHLVNVDGLTQVANRRRFDEYLETQWNAGLSNGHFLGLLLIDIDYFKRYNDNYGHQQGDDCLSRVAQTIDRTIKNPNLNPNIKPKVNNVAYLAARYGGEEFAAILPNTSLDMALEIGELLRKAIEDLAIPHQQSEVSSFVTLSIGVVSWVPCSDRSCSGLITAADAALYRAKSQGRNRVVSGKLSMI